MNMNARVRFPGETPVNFTDATAAVIAQQLADGAPVTFEYHHYTAFSVTVTPKNAQQLTVTVSYTGRREPLGTITLTSLRGVRARVTELDVNAGHDTDTLTDLLTGLLQAYRRVAGDHGPVAPQPLSGDVQARVNAVRAQLRARRGRAA